MQPDEVIYRYGRLSLAYTATLEKLQALERQCEQLTKQVEELTKHGNQQEQAPNAT